MVACIMRHVHLLLCSLTAVAFGADPAVGTITVSPTFIPPNAASQVTITVAIPDASLLLPGGAILQMVDLTGKPFAVLGSLHDDGLNGDAMAGDSVYSIRVTLNESTGRVWLRSAIAFRGLVQRAPSSMIAVDIGSAPSALAIDAKITPPPNATGWSRFNTTVSYLCSGGLGGSNSCAAPVIVSTETASVGIAGNTKDGLNNVVTKTANVKLDKTPPTLMIISPQDGVMASSPLTIHGKFDGALSGIVGVTCNEMDATITASAFSCSVPLVAGSNTVQVQAKDAADNATIARDNVSMK